MSENGEADWRSELADLRRSVTRLEDIHAVRTLFFKYGYYIDVCLYEEAVELFADDGVVRLLNGVWRGKESVRRCYVSWMRQMFTGGVNGPIYGLLLDHFVSQDIITIDDDGLTARGRFRCLMQAGSHATRPNPTPPFDGQKWESGVAENVYVKEGGIWKIKENNFRMRWQADYETGWAHCSGQTHLMTATYPQNPMGPDELDPDFIPLWPHPAVVPFHYPHPITGKPVSAAGE